MKKWNLSGDILASVSFKSMILNLYKSNYGFVLAVSTDGFLYVMNSNLEVLKTIKIHTNWIWGITMTDRNTIITCSEDGTVNLTNLISEQTTCIHKENQPLFCVAYNNNDIINIGSKNGELIRLFRSTKTIKKTKIHQDIIRSIIFYNNDLITCSEDNKVAFFNTKTDKAKTIYQSNNFMQDAIIINKKVYVAGYEGHISSLSL